MKVAQNCLRCLEIRVAPCSGKARPKKMRINIYRDNCGSWSTSWWVLQLKTVIVFILCDKNRTDVPGKQRLQFAWDAFCVKLIKCQVFIKHSVHERKRIGGPSWEQVPGKSSTWWQDTFTCVRLVTLFCDHVFDGDSMTAWPAHFGREQSSFFAKKVLQMHPKNIDLASRDTKKPFSLHSQCHWALSWHILGISAFP